MTYESALKVNRAKAAQKKAELEVEQRAQTVAGLRELADLLEREVSLPIPYRVDGVGYVRGSEPEKIGAVFAASELMDTVVMYDRMRGICTTEHKSGLVRYCVYASVDAGAPVQSGSVAVSSPSQILSRTAVCAEPECSSEFVLSGGYSIKCELRAGHSHSHYNASQPASWSDASDEEPGELSADDVVGIANQESALRAKAKAVSS